MVATLAHRGSRAKAVVLTMLSTMAMAIKKRDFAFMVLSLLLYGNLISHIRMKNEEGYKKNMLFYEIIPLLEEVMVLIP